MSVLAAIILGVVAVAVSFAFSSLQYLTASRIYEMMKETEEKTLKEHYRREGDRHYQWAVLGIYCAVISFTIAMGYLRRKLLEYEINYENQKKKK